MIEPQHPFLQPAKRLLCQRVSDPFPQHKVKGSFDRCSQCCALVRVADTSRDAIKIYVQAEIWCLECCVASPAPGGIDMEYTDAQIEEVARVTGRSPAEVRAQLKTIMPSLRRQGT